MAAGLFPLRASDWVPLGAAGLLRAVACGQESVAVAMSPQVVEATALSLGPGPQSLGREGEEVTAPLSWWPLTTSPSLAE